MKKIHIIAIMLFSGFTFGQQLPQFSQFHRNQAMVNPGATGAYDFLDITLGGRHQWLGFNNDAQGNVAPRTTYLNVANVLKFNKVQYNPAARFSSGTISKPEVGTGKLKHAVGLQVIADEYGAFRNLAFSGTYAVHVPMNDKVNLSLGARVGMSNHAFLNDKAQVLSSMTGGMADMTYDNFIANGYSRMFLDVSSGLYLYSEKFFVGVSANQLTQDFVSFGSGTTNFNPVMHFGLTAGMYFDLNDNLTLMPSFLAKYMAPAPPALQLNMQLEYKQWLWFGLGYRNADAVIAMVGANISERFKLGYSFDYSTSRFNNFSAGGHELVLGFMIR
jgi:type IX secretion system PorP/SprF family membrane protein